MLSRYTLLALATLLFSSVTAQEQYTIDPDSVSLTLRTTWCNQEKSTCPLICQQIPPGGLLENDCEPKDLTYSCICQNGMSPNLTEYSLTLPFFICQEWGQQCVKGCNGDNTCASECTQNHPCGASNPSKPNTTATSTTMSATSGTAAATTNPNQVYNGLGGDDSDSDTGSSGKSAAPQTMRYNVYGTIMVAGFVGLGSILLL
ncbi:hypothetical protein F5Y18DRAFT_204394 [Xylariaceae sp. FL1019]|nr:hypothetical protein F5Y18DRAFT_204394 [Xylariaceae sp. FL1019]